MAGASCQGMPPICMSQATGAQKKPRIEFSECGVRMPWAQAMFEMPSHAPSVCVEEADQGEEADEHDRDVEGELAAVDGAAGDGGDEVLVGVLFVGGHRDGACGCGDLGLGDEHFCDEDGSRSGHDDGGEEVLSVDAEADIGGHDPAGDVGHAGGHDRHELGAGGSGEEGADGEGGFGLAHEDAGGDVCAFGSACAHGALHDPGDDLDDLLHDAEVIEDGKEGADEDDRRKHGEGEDGEGISRCAEGPKTIEEPSTEWARSEVMTCEMLCRMTWP